MAYTHRYNPRGEAFTPAALMPAGWYVISDYIACINCALLIETGAEMTISAPQVAREFITYAGSIGRKLTTGAEVPGWGWPCAMCGGVVGGGEGIEVLAFTRDAI